MRILFFLLVSTSMFFTACKQTGEYEVNGYKYTHVKTKGEKINPGDYVTFSIVIEGDNGKVLQTMTDESNLPVFKIPPEGESPEPANPLIEVLAKTSVGDSISLIMPKDSLGNYGPGLEDINFVSYNAKVLKRATEEEYNKEQEAKRQEAQLQAEMLKARQEEVEQTVAGIYNDLKAGKLDLQTTESGLKYMIMEEGSGPNPEANKGVSVHYYGVLEADGKMFDNSFRAGRPFSFTVGRGEVIRGWDEGIPLIKEGGNGFLVIPYELAYGAGGNPPVIPAEANLIFYVEVEKVL